MKHGMTLVELAETIEGHRAQKQDWLVPAAKAHVKHEEGEFSLRFGSKSGDVGLGMLGTAHAQTANRLGIPKKYYDRMRVEQPELLASNVNTWLSHDKRRFLVRAHGDNQRALLSDAYRPLDNEDLIEAVLPTLLGEMNKGVDPARAMRVESCNVDSSRLYLKVVSPRLEGEVRVGEVVQAGAVLSNSEIGMGSLQIEPMIYTLACTNGMVTRDWGMRRSHVGRRSQLGELNLAEEFYTDATRAADDRALWLKVQDTVRGFFSQEGFEKILGRLRAATEDKLNHREPEKVVEVAAKRFGFNDNERKSVLRHLLVSGDMTRYGLHSAVTLASQDDEVGYQRATELERVGGKVIELAKRDWAQIAQLN